MTNPIFTIRRRGQTQRFDLRCVKGREAALIAARQKGCTQTIGRLSRACYAFTHADLGAVV